jgi:hypothetical protein
MGRTHRSRLARYCALNGWGGLLCGIGTLLLWLHWPTLAPCGAVVAGIALANWYRLYQKIRLTAQMFPTASHVVRGTCPQCNGSVGMTADAQRCLYCGCRLHTHDGRIIRDPAVAPEEPINTSSRE